MGRDCASERVPIALAEADQRTPGRGGGPANKGGRQQAGALGRRRGQTGKIQRLFPSRPPATPANLACPARPFGSYPLRMRLPGRLESRP